MVASPDDHVAGIAQISKAKIEAAELPSGVWIRLSKKIHPDGLGFSAASESRFSDPDRGFCVVYFATDLETTVAEVIVRDRKVGNPGILTLSYEEAVFGWRAVFVGIWKALRVVDLRGTALIGFGIDTDVVRGRSQSLSRRLSQAIHANPHDSFDGILYDSRLTTGSCLALYDRALSKMVIGHEQGLELMMNELGPIYRSMKVDVQEPSGPPA